jgi:hypothetical protein
MISVRGGFGKTKGGIAPGWPEARGAAPAAVVDGPRRAAGAGHESSPGDVGSRAGGSVGVVFGPNVILFDCAGVTFEVHFLSLCGHLNQFRELRLKLTSRPVGSNVL